MCTIKTMITALTMLQSERQCWTSEPFVVFPLHSFWRKKGAREVCPQHTRVVWDVLSYTWTDIHRHVSQLPGEVASEGSRCMSHDLWSHLSCLYFLLWHLNLPPAISILVDLIWAQVKDQTYTFDKGPVTRNLKFLYPTGFNWQLFYKDVVK